jgi:hypothetical protein
VTIALENAAQGHTTVEEEEDIMKNWQPDGSGSDGSYHSAEDELGHLLEKRGLKKVQMIVTPTIFLSNKRYGNPRVSVFLFKNLLHVVY